MDDALVSHADLRAFGVERDGAWHWPTYRDIALLVDRWSACLTRCGVGHGDLVGLISVNHPSWLAAMIATHRAGATLVPMYEAQLPKDWQYILRDANAKVCFTSTDAIKQRVDGLRSELPELAHVLSFAEVECSSPEKRTRAKNVPANDDLAFVIYTSGTTGNPKGVELTHGALASIAEATHQVLAFARGARSVSILPWAHVGGLMEMLTSMHAGITMGIAATPERIGPAIAETKPTHLGAVPRVFNKLYDGIQKAMAARPLPIRTIYERGLRAKIALRDAERGGTRKAVKKRDRLALALAERIIFPKIRARLGGELRQALCGAAALPIDVARFIDALGIEFLELYGLTEVGAFATLNRPGEARLGTVGRALPGVVIKIDGDGETGGEVLIKTPGAMRGYRGLAGETKAVIEDGWIRSGDLGRLDADGFLTITGRVREIYKLENGKFVSPAPIEERLTTSPFIAQAMVHGLNRPFNVALVVVDTTALKSHLGEVSLDDRRVRELVATEVARLSSEFKGYERVARFHLVSEELSLANDMLTPTLKIKRRKVLERWGKDLDALYEA